jgi:hypothetical protein
MFSRTLLQAAAVCTMLSASMLIQGCSDNDSPTTGTGIDRTVYAPITIESEMITSSVAPSAKQDGSPVIQTGATVDSISITKLRMLVARMYLFRDRFASAAGHNTIKKGTALVSAEPGVPSKWVCNGNLPTGTYGVMIFELENTANDETKMAVPEIDTVLRAGPYSTMIDGVAWKNGVGTPFQYTTDALPDLTMEFSPTIVISAGAVRHMVLQVDPSAIFKANGTVLDPADPANKPLMDAGLPGSFKGLRGK